MSFPKKDLSLYERDYWQWLETTVNQLRDRDYTQEALDESPSLKPYLEENFVECYAQAVKQARAETELPSENFPVQCPYLLADAIRDDFLPQ